MPEKILREKLNQLRSELNHQWQQFTPDDLATISAEKDTLVVLFETRYGFARPRAEREAATFIRDFTERLLLAS